MSTRESGSGREVPASHGKAVLGGGGVRVTVEAKPGHRSGPVPSPYFSAVGLKKDSNNFRVDNAQRQMTLVHHVF